MKQMLRIFILLSFYMMGTTLYAYDFEVDGLYFNIVSLENLTCEVTSGDASYEGNIVIPEQITYQGRTLTVTKIGNDAFENNTELTAITMPVSITSIGDLAFYGCTKLTSISIPTSVKSIGTYAFYKCVGLTSLNIPSSVTSIGNAAVKGCTNITNIVLEDGTATLKLGYNSYSDVSRGGGLFEDCPLKTLYLGRNLSYNTSSKYGSSPFCYITSLASVSIGETVTVISESLFRECTGLLSIKCSNSATSIGKYAFYACQKLRTFTVPNSVTEIGDYAFANCTVMGKIEIPNTVVTIGEGAFVYCKALTEISIPSSVTEIGNSAFDDCDHLSILVICDGTTTLKLGYNKHVSTGIGEGLFYDCPLKTLYLGRDISYNTLYQCGSTPFYNTTSLETISFGANLTKVYVYLDNQSGLKTIYSLASVPPTGVDCTNKQYMEVGVNVPFGTLSTYQAADGWKNFWNIQEFDPTGIKSITIDLNKRASIYDLQGHKLNTLRRGINIINGKKFIVK